VRFAPLAEVAELNPRLSAAVGPPDLVSFVPMAQVSAETALTENIALRPYLEVAKGYTPMQRGDLLIAKITPCFENGKIAFAALPTEVGFGSTEFHVIRVRPELADARFLLHFLRRQEVRISGEQRMTGSGGQRRVPANFLAGLPVPVPPLSEQRRIAEILDRAETLRAQRRQALAQLNALGEAIFLEMFGDPVRNDKKWPRVELGELGDVQGGLQLSAGRCSLPETVPYLRVANVHRNRLELGEIKTFKATLPEFERTKLRMGDVLVVEGHGNAEEIGRCALWDGSIPNCSHQNHLIRLRPNTAKAIPLFVASFLNSPGGRQGLLSASNTTSGLNTISVSKVRSCPALLPPVALQLAFAARLERLAQVKRAGEQSLAELNALFASLQHRAFRGEL
jgi:type I restriction enzyme S subunit